MQFNAFNSFFDKLWTIIIIKNARDVYMGQVILISKFLDTCFNWMAVIASLDILPLDSASMSNE